MPSRSDVRVTPGNRHEFDRWREGMRPLFEMDAPDADRRSTFEVQSTSFQFADVALIWGSSSAAVFERGSATLARSPLDQICLLLYTKGGCQLEARGRISEVQAGDVCFIDLSQPVSLVAPDYESLTLILPRWALQPYLANVDDLHGRILHKSSALNALLVSHLWALFEQAPGLSPSEGTVAAFGTAALIAAFAGATADGGEMVGRSRASSALLAYRQYIENGLGKVDLGPDLMCRELGVSRATLFRAFEPMGGINRYILQRRLAQARRLITDPALADERIASIANRCGFSSASVFSRAFVQAFAMSPTQMRAASTNRETRSSLPYQGFGTIGRWLLGLDNAANGSEADISGRSADGQMRSAPI